MIKLQEIFYEIREKFYKKSPFPCIQCGLCCKNLNFSDEAKLLDRGDGTCKNYDTNSKGCSIYNERPEICRVNRMYTVRYSQEYTWKEFIVLNQQVCATLQAQTNDSTLKDPMPIRPTPIHYACPACGWSKTVAPRSDALMPGDYFSACPDCGHANLQTKTAGTLQGEMAQVLGAIEQLWKSRR